MDYPFMLMCLVEDHLRELRRRARTEQLLARRARERRQAPPDRGPRRRHRATHAHAHAHA